MKRILLTLLLLLFCGSLWAETLMIEVPGKIEYDITIDTTQYNYADYQIRQYFKQDLRTITLDANIILSIDKERQIIIINVDTTNSSTIKKIVSEYGYKLITRPYITNKEKEYINLWDRYTEVTNKTILQRRVIYNDSLRITK